MSSEEKSELRRIFDNFEPCITTDGQVRKRYTPKEAKFKALAPNVKIEICNKCGFCHLRME